MRKAYDLLDNFRRFIARPTVLEWTVFGKSKSVMNLIFVFLMYCYPQPPHAQTQIGMDIRGLYTSDYFGYSVCMPDAFTIAIGSPKKSFISNKGGYVQVYSWNGGTWVKKGNDILGEKTTDESGTSISMPDANTIAIGGPENDGLAQGAGHVRVFTWNGSDWIQKGSDIDGEAGSDRSGSSVCMPDANTVSIGASGNDGNGSNSGHVRVYSWSGSAWIQKGNDINGKNASDGAGSSVSMPNANTIAIGAPNAYTPGSYTQGSVSVYQWNTTTSQWVQKGVDIYGNNNNDATGCSVSMPDVNTIAIGASFGNYVRIFTWNGSAWIQKGVDIDGEGGADRSGWSVSMPNANMVAIGAPSNGSSGGNGDGHVRVHRWNGNSWVQKGSDIDGKQYSYDEAGFSVSMPDSNTLAFGAPRIIGYDTSSAAVYSMINSFDIAQSNIDTKIIVYPNPTNGKLILDLNAYRKDVFISLSDVFGRTCYQTYCSGTDNLQITFNLAAGSYLMKVIANSKLLYRKQILIID